MLSPVYSELCNFCAFQLQLELIGNESNKLRICGFSLCITDRVTEKSLQRIQIASVPGHFDGVTDGSFHPAGRGLEGLCHLRVEYLGDGVDHIHITHGDDDGLPQVLIPLDVGGDTDLMDVWLPPHRGDLLLCLCLSTTAVYWLTQMIPKANISVKLETYEYLKLFFLA